MSMRIFIGWNGWKSFIKLIYPLKILFLMTALFRKRKADPSENMHIEISDLVENMIVEAVPILKQRPMVRDSEGKLGPFVPKDEVYTVDLRSGAIEEVVLKNMGGKPVRTENQYSLAVHCSAKYVAGGSLRVQFSGSHSYGPFPLRVDYASSVLKVELAGGGWRWLHGSEPAFSDFLNNDCRIPETKDCAAAQSFTKSLKNCLGFTDAKWDVKPSSRITAFLDEGQAQAERMYQQTLEEQIRKDPSALFGGIASETYMFLVDGKPSLIYTPAEKPLSPP